MQMLYWLINSLVALLIALSVGSLQALARESHPPSPRGIYVVATMKRTIANTPGIVTALNNPNIDGAYISVDWKTVEPRSGAFDWTLLDQQISVVAQLRKNVSLAITAGAYSPDWLFRMGVRSFETVVEPNRQPDFCMPVRIPIPWDEIYLREWQRLVRAFGDHLARSPNLAFVKLTGINYRTEETSLPFGTYARLPPDRRVVSPMTGKSCIIPDDVDRWVAAGYTGAKIRAAFAIIASAFRSAFPRLPVAMMTSNRSFPPLGLDGRPDPEGFALATRDLFAIGRQIFGANFMGQFNGLTAEQTDRGTLSGGSSGGLQTAWYVHGDPFCVMAGGKKPCDEQTVFRETLQRALAAHACYVELFYSDINDAAFEPILREARARLFATAGQEYSRPC